MPRQTAVCDLHACQKLLCQWPQAVQQVEQHQLLDQLPHQLPYQLPYQLQHQLMRQSAKPQEG